MTRSEVEGAKIDQAISRVSLRVSISSRMSGMDYWTCAIMSSGVATRGALKLGGCEHDERTEGVPVVTDNCLVSRDEAIWKQVE